MTSRREASFDKRCAIQGKFVAFVYVLAFKDLMRADEAGSGMILSGLIDALKELGASESWP